MANKKIKKQDDSFESIEETLGRTERYIEENQKSLTIIALAVILIFGGYFAYTKLYMQPTEAKAQSRMYMAERYFEIDSFQLALNGDGTNDGFLDIIDNFGFTKCANLAHYYAGVAYLNLGEYDKAIDFLKSFEADDKIIAPIATGCIGDAYLEKGSKEDAIDYYLKAAKSSSNEFTAPIYYLKAGTVLENLGQNDKAVEIYQVIKTEFPKSQEGRKIDKYIVRAQKQ